MTTIAESKEHYSAQCREHARAIVPLFRTWAGFGDDARALAPDVVESIRTAGFSRMLVPRRWGGYELDLEVVLDVVTLTATGDASAAWNAALLAAHGFATAQFEEDAQRDVWGVDPDAAIACVFAPGGRAERTPDGYRVTGRWRFASGIDSCDWMIGTAFVDSEDGGEIEERSFLLAKGDLRVEDTWFTVGMRGTGSRDAVAEDVYVPAHRTVLLRDIYDATGPGRVGNSQALYKVPLGAAFAPILAGVAVGTASGALEEWIDRARTRRTIAGERTAEQQSSQILVSNTEVAIEAAELLVRETVRRTVEVAESDYPATADLRLTARRNASYATRLAAQAVDDLFRASGAGARVQSNRIERAWRDVNTICGHVILDVESSGAAVGRLRLGEPLSARERLP